MGRYIYLNIIIINNDMSKQRQDIREQAHRTSWAACDTSYAPAVCNWYIWIPDVRGPRYGPNSTRRTLSAATCQQTEIYTL